MKILISDLFLYFLFFWMHLLCVHINSPVSFSFGVGAV